MKAYIVCVRETSRSKHAVNGISAFAMGRFYLDLESAEKERRRQERIYKQWDDFFRGAFIQEVDW